MGKLSRETLVFLRRLLKENFEVEIYSVGEKICGTSGSSHISTLLSSWRELKVKGICLNVLPDHIVHMDTHPYETILKQTPLPTTIRAQQRMKPRKYSHCTE